MIYIAFLALIIILFILKNKLDSRNKVLQDLQLKKDAEQHILAQLKREQESLKGTITEQQKKVSEDGKVVFWTEYLKGKNDKKDSD